MLCINDGTLENRDADVLRKYEENVPIQVAFSSFHLISPVSSPSFPSNQTHIDLGDSLIFLIEPRSHFLAYRSKLS